MIKVTSRTLPPVPAPVETEVVITMSSSDSRYLRMICGRVGGTTSNPVRALASELFDQLNRYSIPHTYDESNKFISRGMTVSDVGDR